jgi:acyl-CoA synthetase (NDP forming)
VKSAFRQAPTDVELSSLFDPQTIVVIGASRDSQKWGTRVATNTLERGFGGRIFGINPNAHGERAGRLLLLPDLESVPGSIDCALIALPASRSAAAVDACARRGVKFAMVLAAGFGETGTEGQSVEDAMVHLARSTGMRLLGPNCFALFSAPARVNLMPMRDVPTGSVAFATQSGYVALELFHMARTAGIGFSRCVGIGNQADLGFGDVLSFFANDPHTEAVTLYMEGIPAGAGPSLLAGLDRCRENGKPVIVLKVGRSTAGAASARTHTNSLAGDDRVWSAALERAGAVRVSSTDEAIDCLQAAVKVPRHSGRTVIVTDSGGASIMALDEIAAHGLAVADLSESTRRELRPLIPAAAPKVARLNPITLDGPGGTDDDPTLLARCVDIVAKDPGVDVIVVAGGLGVRGAQSSAELATAEALVSVNEAGKPIVLHSLFNPSDSPALTRLVSAGIALYPTVPRMIRALASRVEPGRPSPQDHERTDSASADLLSSPPGSGIEIIPPDEALSLLKASGLAVPPVALVKSLDDLPDALDHVGFPICLKVADPRVVHKSEAQGIALNLRTVEDVQCAAQEFRQRFPGSSLLVMPSFPPGVEILVGAFHDPVFGPAVIFGRGGIWVEAEQDIQLRLAPADADQVSADLLRLRLGAQLRGGRGQTPLAVEELIDAICAMSKLALRHPNLTIEVNPLILYNDCYRIADVRAYRERSLE